MNILGLFAKYWEPGRAKTRLAATIGDVSAAEVHRQFLLSMVDRMQEVADRRFLVFTPATRRAPFEQLLTAAWELAPQVDGNLGRRMESFIEQRFQDGADRVVLLGCDSPQLSIVLIPRAFDLLNDFPVVLGPSDDGGYYLLGCSAIVPLFEGIDWGTGAVWQQTTTRLRDSGLKWSELPQNYDVDTLDDLERLCVDLKNLATGDAALQSLLQALEFAVPMPGESGSQ